jgi:hypothetical protein
MDCSTDQRITPWLPIVDAGSRLEDLHRSRNARILGELINVAVWRPKVHPGITVLVLRGVQDLYAAGSEFAGRRIYVVDQKPHNRPGREVTVHVSVGSEDLHFAAVWQLEHLKSWKIKVRCESEDIVEEVDRRSKVVGASTDPSELEDVHSYMRTGW